MARLSASCTDLPSVTYTQKPQHLLRIPGLRGRTAILLSLGSVTKNIYTASKIIFLRPTSGGIRTHVPLFQVSRRVPTYGSPSTTFSPSVTDVLPKNPRQHYLVRGFQSASLQRLSRGRSGFHQPALALSEDLTKGCYLLYNYSPSPLMVGLTHQLGSAPWLTDLIKEVNRSSSLAKN